MKHVIIGNGVAGITAAENLRRFDPRCQITLIGDETFPPYCRPMISLVLEGSVGPEKLPIRSPKFYESLDIEPVLGRRVSGIDVDARTVTVAETQRYRYDRLLIASGADPRPIKAAGLELGNIFYMRTQSQVEAICRALPDIRRALVLGGGLVGFKAAYGLMRRGVAVTMLIRSRHPLVMQVDATAGDMIAGELERRGLDVRVDIEVEAFEGDGTVRFAQLSDGSRLACDLVVIGKGVLPALDFVPRTRITVDLGIRVDDHLQTSIPGIFAAGDVAEHIDVARQRPWVNAIWPEAVAQGRIAGQNMGGRPVRYPGSLSRNVIRIFDLDVLAGGVVNPPPDAAYQTLTHEDRRRGLYRKLVFEGDCLAGMVMVNRIEQGGVLLSAMHSRLPLSVAREALLDPDFNYSRLLHPLAA